MSGRSKNRLFSQFVRQLTDDLTVKSEGIADDAVGGVTVYATRSALPSSGNTSGDQAYVTGNNRLYIWNGSGWYNVALLNLAPSILSVQDSDGGTTPFTLSSEGAVTKITITANDSDGDAITYTASADSDFNGLATVSQDSSIFTITPFSSDSATTTSGTITFTASDGINLGTSGVQTFTLTFAPDWTVTTQQAKIYPANHEDGDTFGESIDIDGDIAVIGAVGDDGEGNSYLSAGAAYVFTKSGSTWTEQAILRPSDISGGENFGHKVCVDGNTIAVSANFKTVSGNAYAGAVYVFTTSDNGSTWTQQQKITASNEGTNDYFGYSLGLSGDLLVVGAHTEDTWGSDAGLAYVFKRTGSTWTQQQQIKGTDTGASDQFGFSAAIDNDTIVIGARNEDNDLVSRVSNCGAVYVFTTSDNGSTWTQQDKFVSSAPTASEQFGAAVDIHGDTIVVGAYQSNSQRGAGWIFTRSGSTWTQRVKLTPSVASGAYFGEQVAIDKENGNVVVIGAPREHISGLADVGCAFVYSTADGGLTWTEDKKITSSDGVANDFFGSSVGINGDTVIVGATHDDTPENYAGAAYIFVAG